jgi:hypothetical protein
MKDMRDKVQESVEYFKANYNLNLGLQKCVMANILVNLAQSYLNGEIGDYVADAHYEMECFTLRKEIAIYKLANKNANAMIGANCDELQGIIKKQGEEIARLREDLNTSEQYKQYRALLDKTRKYKEALGMIAVNCHHHKNEVSCKIYDIATKAL